MLRSMYSGISGLRTHQTKLDVVGNNIANVNTTGFKSSTVQFQDTLSQLTQAAAGPQAEAGGMNPAQIGLGVKVQGVTLNFVQGAGQTTGRGTDLMINGNGFFAVSRGGETLYTRAGAFDLDADGRLVTPDGALLTGWPAVDGVVQQGGQLAPIRLDTATTSPAIATTRAAASGNLPDGAAVGTQLVRDVQAYNATGTARTLAVTFTRTAAGWDVAGDDGASTGSASVAFTDGRPSGGATTLTVGGVAVDLSALTGYAGPATVTVGGANGNAAGTLDAFAVGPDGIVMGSFSNGARQAVGRVALVTFANPAGLEKAGGSAYRATANTGEPVIGAAGEGQAGTLSAGMLEMSNVDLSQEFVDLITAQRGFQANSRVITTSDEVLGELVQLKR
ncbi:flagellar basal-body rod protein FlgF [Sinomonas halotolerans]|uniref:Flagellar basal-body rod protein FlgF n=1 Tax=Sinomonas halotolerans TaxID=1644133 RepID=A0ABU9WZQ2_9MICC